jgi:hypothetical protein
MQKRLFRILPQCLWNNNIDIPQNPKNGLPFQMGDLSTSAGVIDELYLTIKGTAELGINVVSFADCFSPFSYRAWTDINCINTRKNAVANLLLLPELINDKTKLKDVLTSKGSMLYNSFVKWGIETSCMSSNVILPNRCCRYMQGKLLFDVATLFIGIGEVKAAMNGGKIVSYLAGKVDKLSDFYNKFKKASNILKIDIAPYGPPLVVG